jgi:hypothetical protein
MQRDYRVYLFDSEDNIFAIETFRAADDTFALLKSKQLGHGGGFELWRGGDWIARVDRDGRHVPWHGGGGPVTESTAAVNGLYKLEVGAPVLQMVGTVSLIDGTVRGGHSTYAITGMYECSGDAFVSVAYGRRHSPYQGPALFPFDDIRLHCQGWVFADQISGIGSAAELPKVRFDIRLTRIGQ